MKNKIVTIILSAMLIISVGFNVYQFITLSEMNKNIVTLEKSYDELLKDNNSKIEEIEELKEQVASCQLGNYEAEAIVDTEEDNKDTNEDTGEEQADSGEIEHEAEVLTKEELIETLGISEETHYHVDAICEEYYTLLESPYDSSPEEALQLTRNYAEARIKKEVVADNDTTNGEGGTPSSGTSTGGESTGTGSGSNDSIEGAPSQVGSNTNTSNGISENPDYLMSDEEAQALMDQINGGSISQGTPASQEEIDSAAKYTIRAN